MRFFVLMLLLVPCVLATAPYEYFREDQNTSNVWVSVDLPPSGSLSLYVINNSGIIANGSRVFSFFDDFSNQDLTDDLWNFTTTGTGGTYGVNGNLTVIANVGGVCKSLYKGKFRKRIRGKLLWIIRIPRSPKCCQPWRRFQ